MQKMHWNYGIRIRILATRETIRKKQETSFQTVSLNEPNPS